MDTVKQQETGDVELGKRLRRLRLERGLTQHDLAQPRYTHAYVSTIEAGRRMPSDEALEFFAQKLSTDLDELTTGRPKGLAAELRVRLENARLEIAKGNLDQAKAAARRVISEARRFELHRVQARGHEVEALAVEQSGDLPNAINRWESAIDTLHDEAPTARAYAVAGLIRCHTELGDAHHAVFVGENYLERLRKMHMASPGALLRVQSALIHAYFDAGGRDKAKEMAGSCLDLIPKVNDPSTIAAAYVNVAKVQVEEGHHADAIIALAKAEELFETLDLLNEAGIAMFARGISLAQEGKSKEARAVLKKASRALAESGYTAQQLNAEIELARLDRLQGKDKEAEARLQAALELVDTGSQPKLEAWAHRELALVWAKRDKVRSQKHFTQAVNLYELQHARLEVARTHIMMAELMGATDTKGQLEEYRRAAEAIRQIPEM